MQSFVPRDAFVLKVQTEFMSPEMRPKSFRVCEKPAPDLSYSKADKCYQNEFSYAVDSD